MCNSGSTTNSGITVANAKDLKVKWTFKGGEFPTTPAVIGDSLYVGDDAGNMYKLKASDGTMVWKQSVATAAANGNAIAAFGYAGAWARSNPVVTADSVIFGVMLPGTALVTGSAKVAIVVSLDTMTGNVNWATPALDTHGATDIQQSPAYDGTNIYVGITSSEEAGGGSGFIGSLCAIDASKAGKGKLVWQTFMIDATKSSATGASVWGSTPAVDMKRHQIYIGTGNNYGPAGQVADANNHVDSIVALDMPTGKINWAKSFAPSNQDVWNFQSAPGSATAADGDFGSGPNFFTANIGGTMTDLVGAGQKTGMYHALNPDNGAVVWETKFGPTGEVGGIHWGTASDGVRVYAGSNNTNSLSWTLPDGTKTTNGVWGAMNAADGKILWQFAEPNAGGMGGGGMSHGMVTVNGPVRVANGVMFGGAMDNQGTMYAFDAEKGTKLWSFASGGTVYSGAAISGKTVYWGSGYVSSGLGFGTTSKTLYAFSVP